MAACNHTHLVLLADENKNRLRCQHCHLTIKAEELADGYCPECFEEHGKKHYDFEELKTQGKNKTRYRCEDCGVIIESD